MHPVVVWILATGGLWIWHAASTYEAALRSDVIHAVEHLTFIATSVLFWARVFDHRGDVQASGAPVLLVFAMGVQSIFLSLLLTFATTPWYPSYGTTTAAWGLDPLEDQQLAGVLMWVPAGVVYTVAGLVAFTRWVRSGDDDGVSRRDGLDARHGHVHPSPGRLG